MKPVNRRRRQRGKPLPRMFPGEAERIAAEALEREKTAMPLAELSLPLRTVNGLEKKGIFTVAETLELSYAALKSIPNFGIKTLLELAATIEKLGIRPPEDWLEGLHRERPRPRPAPKLPAAMLFGENEIF